VGCASILVKSLLFVTSAAESAWNSAEAVLSEQSKNLTGHWVGRAPDGLLSAPTGSCEQDIALDLTQVGSVLSGTATTLHIGLSCIILSNVEQSTGQQSPVQLTGTVSGSAVSLRGIAGRYNNQAPNQVWGIIASGTFTASRLTMSGGVIAPRFWGDANHNLVPDCDLLNPGVNEECGAVSKPTLPITLTATR
jgi:hypothetical protein